MSVARGGSLELALDCELTCGGCADQVILLPLMYLTGQTSAALSCCGSGLFCFEAVKVLHKFYFSRVCLLYMPTHCV